MHTKTQRNWSQYNHRLKQHSRVEVFVSKESISEWQYTGKRKPGGKQLYSDIFVEKCLLIREYFGLGLRQTEGFVQSLLDLYGLEFKAPDYSTLSRRCAHLKPKLALPMFRKEGLVIAIDSTGLSIYSGSSWNRKKHKNASKYCNDQWRKLHIAIDTVTGVVIAADYSKATHNDCQYLPSLLDQINEPVKAVAADMAYDKQKCRTAIHKRHARQLIPPQKNASLAKNSSKLKHFAEDMKERDDAILYMRYNEINSDQSLAKASWKRKVGYHVRSRVETTLSQIKAHASDKLTNKKEETRKVQALLKCVLINKLAAI
jgi:hypothetical protein